MQHRLPRSAIKMLNAISLNQSNTKYNFSRNNRVFVWCDGETLRKEADVSAATWWRLVNLLVDIGVLVVERADFTFNKTTNAYRIDYKNLKNTCAQIAKYEALLDEVKKRSPAYGLKTIPAYKQKAGSYKFRKGVVNHHRKRQRQVFLSLSGNKGNLIYKRTQCLPEGVNSYLLSDQSCGEEEGEDNKGKNVWLAAHAWWSAFCENLNALSRGKLPLKMPKWVINHIGAAIHKGLINMASAIDHAKFAARSRQNKGNLAAALSFKSFHIFKKWSKGCYNKILKTNKTEEEMTNNAAIKINEEEELSKAIQNITKKSKSQEEINFWWSILKKIGSVSFMSWFSDTHLEDEKKIVFNNTFYRDYCDRTFKRYLPDDVRLCIERDLR